VDILAAILSALFIAAFGWTCSDFRNPAMPRVTMELSGVGNCAEYRGPVPKTGISEAKGLTLLRSAGTMCDPTHIRSSFTVQLVMQQE
jgi:hypothetical protein